jgi:ATP-dependent DNA helicase RecG
MMTEAVVSDETGSLRVVWFRQPYLVKAISVGDELYLSGKPKWDVMGLSFASPAYEQVKKKAEQKHAARIVPEYALTKGISHKQLRSWIKTALEEHAVHDWIPSEFRIAQGLLPLGKALEMVHFPDDHAQLHQAIDRLKFDELFILQLRAERVRQLNQTVGAPKIPFVQDIAVAFVSSLPFTLTADQKRAAWDMLQDLERAYPMNRLLEGDVGAGKTVVAAFVARMAMHHGYQVAIMAPTEVLASQHYVSLARYLEKYGTVGLLTGSQRAYSAEELQGGKTKQKQQLKALLAEGAIDVVVGTHALITEDTQFENLGVVIIDEQHRFGVAQRKALTEKRQDHKQPHLLSMTATPIPRSFALTAYGDLDLSLIKTMPKGRKPIITAVIDEQARHAAYQAVREEIAQGKQCFVICPLIEETGKTVQEKKTVLAEAERLGKEVFPDLVVAPLHGKMKSSEKEAIMAQMHAGEIDVLVSTAVIEVGVDIPNATIMLIEHAERFGLAQLHQFRGRVGRSDAQSYCYVFTDSTSNDVRERLEFFASHPSGFDVAEYDLERRGPGQVYGYQQSGMQQFRLASMRDVELIERARQAAKELDFEAYPVFLERVEEWESRVHLE